MAHSAFVNTVVALILLGTCSAVLRLIPSTVSWKDARSQCKSLGGSLATISPSDVADLQLCPDLLLNVTYWTGGYNFISPWMELTGCYEITNNLAFGVLQPVQKMTDCYQKCKSNTYFGLQVGKCICQDNPFSMLSLTSQMECKECGLDDSLYSCGLNNHVALYKPYFGTVLNNFCKMEHNETCDCGAFQCEPNPIGQDNVTWGYYSRNCSSKLLGACSGGKVTDLHVTWEETRKSCNNDSQYLSGPNIMNWCNSSGVAKRVPHWGHLHRHRQELFVASTDLLDRDLKQISECQHFSLTPDGLKLKWTPDCTSSRGYICSIGSSSWNDKNCVHTTTTTTTTTTEPTTTTTEPTTTTTEPTTTVTEPTNTTTEPTATTSEPTTTNTSPTQDDKTTTTAKPTTNVGGVTGGITATKDEEKRIGIIAGAVIGVAFLTLIIVGLCNVYRSRKKRRDEENVSSNEKPIDGFTNAAYYPDYEKRTNGEPVSGQMYDIPYPVSIHSESHAVIEPSTNHRNERTSSDVEPDKISSHSLEAFSQEPQEDDKKSLNANSNHSNSLRASSHSSLVDDSGKPLSDNLGYDGSYPEQTVNNVEETQPPKKFISVIDVVAQKSENTAF